MRGEKLQVSMDGYPQQLITLLIEFGTGNAVAILNVNIGKGISEWGWGVQGVLISGYQIRGTRSINIRDTRGYQIRGTRYQIRGTRSNNIRVSNQVLMGATNKKLVVT